MKIHYQLTFCYCLFLSNLIYGQTYNILDYGAKSDTTIINTKAIQMAIDDCSLKGGGTVIVPGGVFVTGTLELKDNTTLYLQKMSVIRGREVPADYPAEPGSKSLIYINNVENISITGEGIIDGRGNFFNENDSEEKRPTLIWAIKSKNVRIENVTLRNSACWTLKLSKNSHVFVRGISIYSHSNLNNDGIDIESKDVVISDCIIDCDDDALCFKSDTLNLCENVVVSNCILASNCNFIKMGTGGATGFKNISINNCVLRPASESAFRFWNTHLPLLKDSIIGLSGIALEVVDGGTMDQVTITNISMKGIMTPIFIRLGSRKNPTGILKNVIISNIIATSQGHIASSITAVPGSYIENVILRDIIINSDGGGTISEATTPVEEREKWYPENFMFGLSLPTYGLYIRHARNITIDNLQFNLSEPDARPAIWLEDAHNILIKYLKTNNRLETIPKVQKVNTSDVKILKE
jgi:polygalacturonase